MHARLKLSLLTAIVAAMGLLVAPAAMAQYAPTGDDYITCTPDPAPPGATVECEAGFFAPGSPGDWTAVFSATLERSGEFEADDEGVARFTFEVPEDAPNGSYEITLEGTGPDGEPKVLAERNVVGPEAARGASDRGQERAQVARTGSDTGTYLGAAAVLLLIGGGAVYFTRRRSTTSV